jgi:nucleotide-binding universal stress UspA family protein
MDDISARRRSLRADELARAAAEAGVDVEAIEDFAVAASRGRDLARELDGVLVVTGSHYALAPARAALALCEDSPR